MKAGPDKARRVELVLLTLWGYSFLALGLIAFLSSRHGPAHRIPAWDEWLVVVDLGVVVAYYMSVHRRRSKPR